MEAGKDGAAWNGQLCLFWVVFVRVGGWVGGGPMCSEVSKRWEREESLETVTMRLSFLREEARPGVLIRSCIHTR